MPKLRDIGMRVIGAELLSDASCRSASLQVETEHSSRDRNEMVYTRRRIAWVFTC